MWFCRTRVCSAPHRGILACFLLHQRIVIPPKENSHVARVAEWLPIYVMPIRKAMLEVGPHIPFSSALRGEKVRPCCFRNAKTAGAFLLVLEASWNITGRSMRMIPTPLAYVLKPLLRPLHVCMGYVRWTCWAALCYLIARTAQHRCAALRAGADADPGTPPAAHTPVSFATPPPAATAPAGAAAAVSEPSPRRTPGAAAELGSATLTPAAATSAPDGRRSPASRALAASPSHEHAAAATFGRSPGAGSRIHVEDGSGPCGHGYRESCPHGCDVFGGEMTGQQDENRGAMLQEGGGIGGDGGDAQDERGSVAGYVLQQGLHIADAARAWASRSRNFVRV